MILSHSSNYLHFLSLPFPKTNKPRIRTRWPWPCMISSSPSQKNKILVILGPTGSGKTRLSIDIATCFPSEIINSDKMQLYNALDITTNKIPFSDRRHIPHHLLGNFTSLLSDISPSDFRSLADTAISDVVSRNKLPLIVGGSNSFIQALVSNPDQFPDRNNFRYRCCFIWVDVFFPVLKRYLFKRVDDMLESGMVEELAEFYEPETAEIEPRTGLRKAIGVPEFDRFFKRLAAAAEGEKDRVREDAYEEAVRAIKENTCQLTIKQLGKIERMREMGWDLKKVDATAAVEAVLTAETAEKWSEIWEREVVEPSVKIVKSFIQE